MRRTCHDRVYLRQLVQSFLQDGYAVGEPFNTAFHCLLDIDLLERRIDTDMRKLFYVVFRVSTFTGLRFVWYPVRMTENAYTTSKECVLYRRSIAS